MGIPYGALGRGPNVINKFKENKMKNLKSISKFLSLILRHEPERVGITLDEAGWVDVKTLIVAVNGAGKRLDEELLREVVESNDKQRFTYSDDGVKIRANQGHSISVDLELEPQTPPDYLYHGTATRFVASIKEHGIEKRSRQHVHLSADKETATKVGQRHGKVIILSIRSKAMAEAGHKFYLSKNNVWLTDEIPVKFLDL